MNWNIFEQKEDKESKQDDFSLDHVSEVKNKIEKRLKRQRKLKMIVGGLALLVILLAGLTSYSQYRLHTLSTDEMGQRSVSPKTADEVIKALSRHILVPSGTPQIAEVQDAEKLKSTQAFFKDAENGDIVIVYDTTIFIYRPSRDIVVAAGDISGADQLKP